MSTPYALAPRIHWVIISHDIDYINHEVGRSIFCQTSIHTLCDSSSRLCFFPYTMLWFEHNASQPLVELQVVEMHCAQIIIIVIIIL